MSVPPLRLSNNFDTYISGEVTIAPSAVIAPGVILQAAVNSKIIIGPGVCIGMGSILQVHEGILEVEAGANLGAGLLMVGQGKIGANACIGSATTVFHCSVAPGQVVAPGSVLGDTGRQIVETQPSESSTNSTADQPDSENVQVISSTHFSASAQVEFKHESISFTKPASTPPGQSPPEPEPEAVNQPETESANTFGTQIYGQGSIQRLLVTLFPHRQSFNDPKEGNHSD